LKRRVSLTRHSPAPCVVLVFAAGHLHRARPSGRASACAAPRRVEPFKVGTGALRRPLSGAFPSAAGQLPHSAGQCGDRASGDIAARWSLPVFVRNPVRIEIIQPRVGPSRTGEELPWVVVQTNHSTLTGLHRFSAISRRRCLATRCGPNLGLAVGTIRAPGGLAGNSARRTPPSKISG